MGSRNEYVALCPEHYAEYMRRRRMSTGESLLRLACVICGFALGELIGPGDFDAESVGSMSVGAFTIWMCARYFWTRPI